MSTNSSDVCKHGVWTGERCFLCEGLTAPDFWERRADRLEKKQRARCTESPPIGPDETAAEDRIKERIRALRAHSKTYNRQ